MNNKVATLVIGGMLICFSFLFIFGSAEVTLKNSLGFALLFILIITSIINFKIGILFYLFIRNLLDYFRDASYFLNNPEFNLASWVTICFILFALLNILSRRLNVFKIKEIHSFIFFLVAIIPSIIFSFSKTTSFADWLRFFGLFIFYISIYFFFYDYADLKNIILVLITSLIIPSIVSVEQLIKGEQIYDAGFLRIFGTYIHPNMLAFYLITIGLLIISLILSKNKILNRSFGLTLLVVISVLLILTYTRSAWLGFCLGLIALLNFKKRKAIPIVIMFAMLIHFIPSIQHRFSDIWDNSIRADYSMSSWQWRTMFWEKTIGGASKNPLFGIGLGTFPLVNILYAHNDYLRMFVETGILGLGTYVFLFLSIIFNAFKKIKESQNYVIRDTSLAVFAIGCAYLLISFSDNLSRSTAVLVYYFALVAITDRLFKEEQKEKHFG